MLQNELDNFMKQTKIRIEEDKNKRRLLNPPKNEKYSNQNHGKDQTIEIQNEEKELISNINEDISDLFHPQYSNLKSNQDSQNEEEETIPQIDQNKMNVIYLRSTCFSLLGEVVKSNSSSIVHHFQDFYSLITRCFQIEIHSSFTNQSSTSSNNNKIRKASIYAVRGSLFLLLSLLQSSKSNSSSSFFSSISENQLISMMDWLELLITLSDPIIHQLTCQTILHIQESSIQIITSNSNQIKKEMLEKYPSLITTSLQNHSSNK